ncbi:ferredoxin [Streptomyces sp. CWNU-52B]|uniref:ferredoxin n=1 Tax=unclassified Streptomyces TaxID=2593676 RepID=UPI0039BFAED1
MKVDVDQVGCAGAGQCVLSAPEVFDQREDDGVVDLLTASPEPDLHERVREAAHLCPTASIRLTEA